MRNSKITTMKVMITLLFLNLGACTQAPDKVTSSNEQTNGSATPTPLPAASSSEGKLIMEEKLARLNKLLNMTAEESVETEDDKNMKKILGPTDRQRKIDLEQLRHPCIYGVAIENSKLRVSILGCQNGPSVASLTSEANASDLNPEGVRILDGSIIVPCKRDNGRCVNITGRGGRIVSQYMTITPHNLIDSNVEAKHAERYRLGKPGVLKDISDAFAQVIGIAQK